MQDSLRKCFLVFFVSAVEILQAQPSGRDSIVTIHTELFGSHYDDRKKASDIPNKPTETLYGELHYRDGKMVSMSSTGRGPWGWDSSMTTIRYDASGRKKHSSMRQASSRQCFLSLAETDYSDSLIITRKHDQYYCADQVQHQFLTDTVFLSTSLLPDSSLHYEDEKLRGSRVFAYKFYDDGRLLEKKMISSGIYGSAGNSHTVIYRYAYHGKDTLQTYTSSYLGQDTLEQSPFERVYDANGYEIMNIYRKGDSVTAILTYTRDSSGRIENYESRKPDLTVLGVGRYLYKDDREKHEQLYIGGNVSYLRTDTLVRSKSRRVNHYQSSASLPAGTNSIPDKVAVKLYSSTWLNKEGLVTKKVEYKFGKPVSIQRYTYSYK